MSRRAATVAGTVLMVWGCSKAADHSATSKAEQPTKVAANAAAPAIPPPETGPDARTPLAEPNAAINSRSVEAAGQVVQHYGALVEQKRWTEANRLWGDAATAAKFTAELAQYADARLEIGNAGDAEGAAGSIYVKVPAIFYGDLRDGQPFRRSADVILRRVNDVPGSTEKQRRWHIERIEWGATN